MEGRAGNDRRRRQQKRRTEGTQLSPAPAQERRAAGPPGVRPADDPARAGARAAERARRDLCVWTGGAAAGIQRAAVPDGLPGLRGAAGGGTRAATADET